MGDLSTLASAAASGVAGYLLAKDKYEGTNQDASYDPITATVALRQAQAALTAADERIAQLERSLAAAVTSPTDSDINAEELEELQSQIASLRTQLANATAALTDEQLSQLDSLQSQVGELTTQLHAAQEAYGRATFEASQQQAADEQTIADLRQQVAGLQAQLDEAGDSGAVELQQQLNTANSKLATLRAMAADPEEVETTVHNAGQVSLKGASEAVAADSAGPLTVTGHTLSMLDATHVAPVLYHQAWRSGKLYPAAISMGESLPAVGGIHAIAIEVGSQTTSGSLISLLLQGVVTLGSTPKGLGEALDRVRILDGALTTTASTSETTKFNVKAADKSVIFDKKQESDFYVRRLATDAIQIFIKVQQGKHAQAKDKTFGAILSLVGVDQSLGSLIIQRAGVSFDFADNACLRRGYQPYAFNNVDGFGVLANSSGRRYLKSSDSAPYPALRARLTAPSRIGSAQSQRVTVQVPRDWLLSYL